MTGFESYNFEDIEQILSELTDFKFSENAIKYLATRTNQFRQLIKLINKIEKLSETNKIQEFDEYALKGLLNERRILTRAESNVVSELVPVKNLTECRIDGSNL